MAITKDKKAEIAEKLAGVKDAAASIVFTGFAGLTVHEATALRNALRERGVQYFVAKRTLFTRAFGNAFKGAMPTLDGNQVAIAWGTDAIVAPQQILAAAQTYKNKISILGGVFEGDFKDKAEMMEIATIPSLQVLRGMFVNVINSPIQGLVIALDQIAEKKQ